MAGNVWVMRCGREGEFEKVFPEAKVACAGWKVGDISGMERDEIKEEHRRAYSGYSERGVANRAGQFLAFSGKISTGDKVVMPLKPEPKSKRRLVLLGTVKGGYRYRKIRGELRHTIPVEWQNEYVSKTDLPKDLQSSMRARQTVSRMRPEGAYERICAMMDG